MLKKCTITLIIDFRINFRTRKWRHEGKKKKSDRFTTIKAACQPLHRKSPTQCDPESDKRKTVNGWIVLVNFDDRTLAVILTAHRCQTQTSQMMSLNR